MTTGDHGPYAPKAGDELLQACWCGAGYDLRPAVDVRACRGWSCGRAGCVDGVRPYRENDERRGRPPKRRHG